MTNIPYKYKNLHYNLHVALCIDKARGVIAQVKLSVEFITGSFIAIHCDL